jgi:hypothetical protein
MSKELDKIFDEIVEQYYDKVHELNAIIMEAKDVVSQYDSIKLLVLEITSNPNPDDDKILELRENFYRLVKHINSINQEIYEIIFETDIIKDKNQSTE